MQHVRVYGEVDGEKGCPRRLDLDSNGTFVLELHGGARMNGRFTQEDGKLILKTLDGEIITAEEGSGLGCVALMGTTLAKTVTDVFSVSCQKARQASKVTELTQFTTKTCEQKIEEAVYNSTHNHGIRPQLQLRPPHLLREMATFDLLGSPPARVQGVVENSTVLEGLSLRDGAISYNDLRTLCQLIEASAELRLLDLRGALDVKGEPAIPKEEVEREVQRLSEVWGTIKEDDEDEKLEKLKAAIAPQDYTTVSAALKHLARENLNRMNMLLGALKTNASVTQLDLSCNSLGTDGYGKKSFKQLRMAKSALEDHPTLMRLNLSGNEMGPKGTGVLIKGLAQNIHINELDISGNGICDEEEEENDDEVEGDDPAFGEPLAGLEAVADLLKKNKFLRKLNLSKNNMKAIELPEEDLTDTFGDDTPLYKMLHPLKSFYRLTVLDISGNDLGPGGAYILGAAVKRNKSLTSLNLNEAAIGPKGLEWLATHLTQANNIKTLELRRNDFAGLKGKRNAKASTKALAAFSSYLKSDANHLEKLDVAYNNMGTTFCKQVLDSLTNSSITYLDISLNHLCGTSTNEYHEEGVEALATLITQMPVTTLVSQWNFLQSSGATVLSKALCRSEIHTLDLTQNHLRGVGLSEICKQADKLVILKAGSNGSCGEAAVELAALLERSSILKMLDVSDNAIGTEGMSTLLGSVSDSKLTSLNINKNLVGPAVAPQVGLAVRHLRTLDVGDNNLGTDAIMKHILPSLARNGVVRTLIAWGGEGKAAECLNHALDIVNSEEGSDSLIHLDLGVPLTEVGNPASVNACAAKLLENLKRADFGSALEVAL